MKRAAFLIIMLSVLLASCGPGTKNIATSTGEAPTPVEELTLADTATNTPVTPGETAAPAPTATPTMELELSYSMLAFIALDGNIYLKNLLTGSESPLTADASTSLEGGGDQIIYTGLKWSSDGMLLAYQRQVGKQITSGLEYHFSLWVYDMDIGNHREVLADVQTAGFAWQPGTHVLSYAQSVNEGYFTSRARVDASLATGILGIDVDWGGSPVEIIPPSAGYSLVSPHWSADGRIVTFNEVLAMEGAGYFAYYDMDAAQYTRYEQQVGGYDLAPDGSWIVFDTQTYIPQGTERIWKMNLDWSGKQRISPDFSEGYAFMPRLSPDGTQVAYFRGSGMPGEPGMDQNELLVQPVEETSAPQSFGSPNAPRSLDWMPDGKSLILTVEAPEHMQIISIRLEDAYIDMLAIGSEPAVRP